MSALPPYAIAWCEARRDGLGLARRITGAMRHPWVASYAVGFGPPLTRIHPRVDEAVRASKSAFEKLERYAQLALADLDLQLELARRQAALEVRLHGSSTGASEGSYRALDLELRLHHPDTAPPAVAEAMRAAGLAAIPAESERRESRLLVRLDDPFGAVLAHRLGRPTSGQVLEHRVWPEAAEAWRAFAERLDPPLDGVIAVG